MSARRGGGRGQLLFFFFQAEDGIRDIGVTGVQTCALPISVTSSKSHSISKGRDSPLQGCHLQPATWLSFAKSALCSDHLMRSEERRVGKECRSRWSPYH